MTGGPSLVWSLVRHVHNDVIAELNRRTLTCSPKSIKKHKHTHTHTNKHTHTHSHTHTHRHTCTYRHTCRDIDTDRWTDRQTDRQM